MRTDNCMYRNYQMDDDRRENDRREERDVILRCGSGNSGPLPEIDVGQIKTPIPVGSVNIDTRNMGEASILVNANLQIYIPQGAEPTIIFQLVKKCNGATIPVGGSHTFSTTVEASTTQGYNIQYCDCTDCRCCATYSLEIIEADIDNPNVIINADLIALAVKR